ncbi:hypothetical protein [Hymenobacter glaciei]
MTEERKNLYRKLLYTAMLEMRGQSFWPDNLSHSQNLQGHGRSIALEFIYSLTDWLHNLALHSSQGFEKFDENWFWQDYQIFREQFPSDKWAPFLEGAVNQLKK